MAHKAAAASANRPTYAPRLSPSMRQRPRAGMPARPPASKAAVISSVAAKQTVRLARYTRPREWPTTSLLRRVPSLCSVPRNRLVNTAHANPMSGARLK